MNYFIYNCRKVTIEYESVTLKSLKCIVVIIMFKNIYVPSKCSFNLILNVFVRIFSRDIIYTYEYSYIRNENSGNRYFLNAVSPTDLFKIKHKRKISTASVFEKKNQIVIFF